MPVITDGSDRNDAIAGDGRSAWLEIPHVAGLALAEYTLSCCFPADRLPPRGENAVLLSKDTHPSPEGGLSIELITSATTGQTRLRIYIAVAGAAVWLGGTAGKREGLRAEILAEVAHHVAVVLNGDGVKLYLDGAEIGADPAQKTGWTDNARRISVLAWDGSDGWFDGIFDEPVIYDHGLTESEIADLARARTAPNPGIHAEPGVQIFDAAYATEWRFTVEVGAPGKDRRVYVALAWNSETIGSAPESCTLDGVAGRLVTPEAAQQWNRAAAVEWLEADLPARAGTYTVTITWPAGDRALGRAYPLSCIGHEQIAAMAQGSNAALNNVALDIRSTYNFPGERTSDPYAPYPGALQPDETKAAGGSNHIGPRPNSFASF